MKKKVIDTQSKADRVFLVVVDDTEEMQIALRYASLRAKKTRGIVALLYVIESSDQTYWVSVKNIGIEEQRKKAEDLMQDLSSVVLKWSGTMPVLFIKEGNKKDCLLELIEEEKNISILVLGAATGSEGPGPLVSELTKKNAGEINIPITIVPGNLSYKKIQDIS
jgi:nucleotide-binding universal stress UspA family protein